MTTLKAKEKEEVSETQKWREFDDRQAEGELFRPNRRLAYRVFRNCPEFG
jgi:hypothetical protein